MTAAHGAPRCTAAWARLIATGCRPEERRAAAASARSRRPWNVATTWRPRRSASSRLCPSRWLWTTSKSPAWRTTASTVRRNAPEGSPWYLASHSPAATVGTWVPCPLEPAGGEQGDVVAATVEIPDERGHDSFGSPVRRWGHRRERRGHLGDPHGCDVMLVPLAGHKERPAGECPPAPDWRDVVVTGGATCRASAARRPAVPGATGRSAGPSAGPSVAPSEAGSGRSEPTAP